MPRIVGSRAASANVLMRMRWFHERVENDIKRLLVAIERLEGRDDF